MYFFVACWKCFLVHSCGSTFCANHWQSILKRFTANRLLSVHCSALSCQQILASTAVTAILSAGWML